ncbi:MAG: DUF6979 family protein [Christensenellales bacterium]
MGKYGEIAVRAARYVNEGIDPTVAWEKASCEVFEPGSSAQKKGCPKNAFLGLHGGKGKNADYAKAALKYLKENPGTNVTENELWEIITEGTAKRYNQQMDVVLTLYKERLI